MNWDQSVRDKVMAFVEDNPHCTARDVSNATDVPHCRTRAELAQLKRRGHLISEKVEGERLHYYSMPDAHLGENPCRIIVKQWARPTIAKQSWLSALGV